MWLSMVWHSVPEVGDVLSMRGAHNYTYPHATKELEIIAE